MKSVAMTSAMIALVLGATVTAHSGATPAQKCEGGKNGAAGKYAACLHKAQQKYLLGGETDLAGSYEDVQKCADKQESKWTSLEDMGDCPSTGDQSSVRNFVFACVLAVEDAVRGGTLPLDVASCNYFLSSCDADRSSCNSDLSSCNANLSSCSADLATTDADLSAYRDSPLFAAGCGAFGGAMAGVSCWFYGSAGESCDTVCSNVGLAYSDTTRTYAGSDGTAENCDTVIQALVTAGVPIPSDVNGSGEHPGYGDGQGCSILDHPSYCPETIDAFASCWFRDLGPTTSDASQAITRRICACQ